MLIAKASLCPDLNGIKMIVVAILIGLFIVVTGDDCGNLVNRNNHVSRVVMGRIDNRGNF
jgi:hypothetical protein